MSKQAAEAPVEKPAEKKPAGEVASTFIERFAGKPTSKSKTEDKPKEEPKPGEEKPKEEKPKEGEKPKEEKPKEEAKKVEPLAPPPIDAAGIAKAAASGVAEAMDKRAKAEAPKPPAPTDGLDAKEAKKYEVFQRMEKDFGEQYKGFADKYVASVKKTKAYEDQWKKENPGKKFNPEDEDHNEFFAENDIDWDDDHYAEAMANMAAERMLERRGTKDSKEIAELKRQNAMRDESPKIEATKRQHAKSFFSALGDDYKGIIGENNAVNLAEVKRLVEEDPVKAIVFQMADSVETFAEIMHKLTSGLEDFNEKNANHMAISDFVTIQEVRLKNETGDKQINAKGQRFATAAEYAALTPAEQSFRWRLSPDDIMAMYAQERSIAAQQAIAEEEKRSLKIAERRGYKKAEGGTAEPPKVEEKPKEEAAPPAQKPVSPSGTVEPRIAPSPTKPNGAAQTAAGSFINRWTGRS